MSIVGNLIKDGTYAVTGEQTYDPKSREWTSARWSVEINTELANQGLTIAHSKGSMLVESRDSRTSLPRQAPRIRT